MLLLTDCPDRARQLLPCAAAPALAPAAALTPGDRALWHALAAGGPPSMIELDGGAAAGCWSRLCIVGDAPRSQFDVLRDAYPDAVGAAEPVACLALAGRDFHGHRGRPWQAVDGNLHLSVGFVPRLAAAELLPALVMLPAVALVAAVAEVTAGAIRPGIKWVNDVLCQGRKVGGVLTTTSTRGDRARSAVLGIGLNVGCAPAVAPTPFVPEVGSLGELATPAPSLGALLWALLGELGRRIAELERCGPEPLWTAYRRDSLVVGAEVRIYDESMGERELTAPWPEPLARGVVEELEPDLGLRLRGYGERVARGRLAFEHACRRFGL
jgi:biotin-(acetyl-CoA carboxylase) ligase